MFLLPPHVVEQLYLRLLDEECVECVRLGYCNKRDEEGELICGCSIPAKMYDPWSECASEDGWGKMVLNKTKYKEFRKEFPIKVKIEYGRV